MSGAKKNSWIETKQYKMVNVVNAKTITVVHIRIDRNDTRLDAVCGLFELPMIT